jgi:hypothetical protein
LAIVIAPYRPEHEPAVAEFNRRLQSGGAESDLVFYRYAVPHWLPPDRNLIYNQYFVAVENGEVRGGYALKWQNFWFPDSEIRPVGYYHHPLSEGIVNKAYAIVGTLLLRDAMQRSPLLYCLGMGGYDRPLPKMLVGLGWSHLLVPFYFRVVRPYRFLRQMQALRSSWWRALAADAAAFSGAGWVGAKAYQMAAHRRPVAADEVTKEAGFSSWADALWEEAKTSCAMTAVRDSRTMQRLYPATDDHFTRLRIRRGGKDIGWAVVAERRKDPKFGSLRVGSIVDCWAPPDDASTVIHTAADALEQLGMDLIVSNQSHQAWCKALEAAGFLKAQSNFILACSKKLAGLVQPFDQMKLRFHFTRADGDGLPRNF